MDSKKPAVLIIDDDISTIRLMGEVLSELYEVSFATSSEQGLSLAASADTFDLILLDIKMPGTDGYNLCRLLKQNEATSRTPVIFVTSCSQAFEEAFGFRLGAVDYITKPISPEVLKARVKTHVTLYRQALELEKLSSVDPLTKIANRRRFNEFLENQWKSSTRSGSTLSIVLLDVDNFKAYNDHYGHGLGDKCLEKIGHTLQLTCRRSNDLAARVGGEEFAIVLPDTDEKGAVELAESVRNNILELSIPHKRSDAGGIVTASIGVSACNPSPTLTFQALYQAADAQMYKIKNNGKNGIASSWLE